MAAFSKAEHLPHLCLSWGTAAWENVSRHVSTGGTYEYVHSNIIKTVPRWKRPSNPSTLEWVSELQDIHKITKRYIAVRINQCVHKTTWMTLKYMKLEEIAQSLKTVDCVALSWFYCRYWAEEWWSTLIFIISNNRHGVALWGFSSNKWLDVCVWLLLPNLRY